MKISTKGRYGLQFILDLALFGGAAKSVSLRDVAARQGISEKYLWQVVTPLRAAGLITAVRGARGGFALARHPQDLTLREVVQVLEGGAVLNVSAQAPKADDGVVAQVAYGAWDELGKKISEALDSIRLKDLVEQCKIQQSKTALDYVI